MRAKLGCTRATKCNPAYPDPFARLKLSASHVAITPIGYLLLLLQLHRKPMNARDLEGRLIVASKLHTITLFSE